MLVLYCAAAHNTIPQPAQYALLTVDILQVRNLTKPKYLT